MEEQNHARSAAGEPTRRGGRTSTAEAETLLVRLNPFRGPDIRRDLLQVGGEIYAAAVPLLAYGEVEGMGEAMMDHVGVPEGPSFLLRELRALFSDLAAAIDQFPGGRSASETEYIPTTLYEIGNKVAVLSMLAPPHVPAEFATAAVAALEACGPNTYLARRFDAATYALYEAYPELEQ